MTTILEYPPRVYNSPNAWLLKPMWKKVHRAHQHLPMVIVGKPGSGKSLLALELAWMFYPKFKPEESVVFSAAEFSALVEKHLPIGFPIIIDDAGLSAASGDAQTREVKAISKIFQSVRSRRLMIILTLPNFFLLAKSVRTLIDYYLEPIRINKEQNICHAKFRILKINPLGGEVYRYSPIVLQRENHWTGYKHTTQVKMITIPFNKPPEEICQIYEDLKTKRMQEFNTKQSKTLNKDSEHARREKIREVAEAIKLNPEKFANFDGELNLMAISEDQKVNKTIVRDALELAGFLKEKRKGRQNAVFVITMPKPVQELNKTYATPLEEFEAKLKSF